MTITTDKDANPVPFAPPFPAHQAQVLRDALRLIETTTVDVTMRPSKENEAAHFEACKHMAKLMTMLPAFMRSQDNKIAQLIGMALGTAAEIPAIAATIHTALVEIAPDEYEEMKQAIAVYGGKCQGNA